VVRIASIRHIYRGQIRILLVSVRGLSLPLEAPGQFFRLLFLLLLLALSFLKCQGSAAGHGRLPARPTIAVTARATTGPAIETAALMHTSAAFGFRAGLIDVHSASAQLGSVQLRDGGVRSLPVAHFHKRKAAGLTRRAIRHDLNAIDCAKLAERGFQIRLSGIETQISNEDIGHCRFPS
jgi:hypothetical protein